MCSNETKMFTSACSRCKLDAERNATNDGLDGQRAEAERRRSEYVTIHAFVHSKPRLVKSGPHIQADPQPAQPVVAQPQEHAAPPQLWGADGANYTPTVRRFCILLRTYDAITENDYYYWLRILCSSSGMCGQRLQTSRFPTSRHHQAHPSYLDGGSPRC